MDFFQRVNQFQECVYCSEIDCVAMTAKNNEAIEAEALANLTPGIPSRLLESLGSSDGLVRIQTAVPRLLRRPSTQTNCHIA